MITRRGFLTLIAPAAGALLVPELLLPKRTFFLPPAGGWCSYSDYINEMLSEFESRILNPAAVQLAQQYEITLDEGPVFYQGQAWDRGVARPMTDAEWGSMLMGGAQLLGFA